MYFSPKEKTLKSIYNILTYIADFHIKIIAQFNPKLKLGVKGRAETFNVLKANISSQDKVIWFHCASLGEYEQGLPVFEKIKLQYPKYKIVLSFFSPSGYEIRKNAPIADVVVYLPLDTKQNAKYFLNLVHPELVVFVKYEFWPNYLNELKKRRIRSILISALFRKDQNFFKSYGAWMRKSLHAFEHIFVQNEASKKLLNTINYTNVTVSGDTRFDRVSNQLQIDNSLDFIEKFKGNELCVVAGSTWPEDEQLFIDYINAVETNTKFIIAPHNIKPQQIESLKKAIQKKTVLFSEKEHTDLIDAQVFIIDTIGILTKIYSYANIAYVGGAMGSTGLHNTLEPAVFGIPVLIGPNYKGFKEAEDLVSQKGALCVTTKTEFNTIMNQLTSNIEFRTKTGKINAQYVLKNKGASIQIVAYIHTLL